MDGKEGGGGGFKRVWREAAHVLRLRILRERLESPAADSTHGPGQNETLDFSSRL